MMLDVCFLQAAASLGTTQRVGCAGDFCHYDTSLADVDGDCARLDRASKLSEFRKKITDADGALALAHAYTTSAPHPP